MMIIQEKDAQKNLQKNLDFLMKKNNISTRKHLASVLGISEPLLSKIMKDGSIPTVYPFFASIRDNFSYSIDEMLFSDIQMKEYQALQKQDTIPEVVLTRYLGLFQIYHFSTTSFKGRERGEHGKALRSGILYIVRNPETRELHKAYAIFGQRKEAADQLYAELASVNSTDGSDGVIRRLRTMDPDTHVYQGEVEITVHQVYFSFWLGNRDRAFMIFHHPDGTSSQYLGGLGCLLSTSKGRYPRPCMQYAAISRKSLPTAREEIAQHLVTPYPLIKTYEYMGDLLTFIKDLYLSKDSSKSRLSDEEKEMMLRFHIDKIVNETIEKNACRTAVVSLEDDDDFYHYIKAVTKVRNKP